MTTPTTADIYDAYLRAASEPDAARRLELLTACATEDFEILSPFPYEVHGLTDVCRQLGQVAAASPGGRLSLHRTSPIDAHHHIFRAMFENRDASGALLSTGLHVGQLLGPRLCRLLVFVPQQIPTD